MALQQIQLLKSLHRNEIAATEAYVQLLERLDEGNASGKLTAIRNEHREHANELRKHVHEIGEQPDQNSDAWDVWTQAIRNDGQEFGKVLALQALQEGEQHTINTYKAALKEAIPEECKIVIRSTFLPRSQEHLKTLEQLMSS